MKIKLNDNFDSLKQSYLFSETAKRARQYAQAHPDQKIISLGIGDVTQPLAASVVAALKSAAEEMGEKSTFRGYAPEYGYAFLQQAVANYYARVGVQLKCSEVFISDGAKSDLGNIVDILGDNKILIPNPVYPVYLDSNLMSGRKIEFIDATIENGFLPCPPESLEAYVIYLCSPNNPTGAAYSREGLKAWVDYALKTGSLIIFDSAYESFITTDLPHSIFEIEGARECAIEINSLSKMAGFTGTRCGFTLVPQELCSNGKALNQMWGRRQATKFNGVSYIIQRGAEAVFSAQGQSECKLLVEYYLQNARTIANVLQDKNIWFTGGVCSPYLWLRCPHGLGSWEFFDYLLNKAQIVGTPGVGFGSAGEGFFRLTSFGSAENTLEAAERLKILL